MTISTIKYKGMVRLLALCLFFTLLTMTSIGQTITPDQYNPTACPGKTLKYYFASGYSVNKWRVARMDPPGSSGTVEVGIPGTANAYGIAVSAYTTIPPWGGSPVATLEVTSDVGSLYISAQYAQGSTLVYSTNLYERVVPGTVPTANLIMPSGILCHNGPVTITADVTNEGSTPTYRWYINNSLVQNNNSKSLVSSATSNPLKDDDVVRFEFTSSGCVPMNQGPVIKTVTMSMYPPVDGKSIPATVFANYNTTGVTKPAIDGVAAAGGNGSYVYRWQKSTSNSPYNWQNISDQDSFGEDYAPTSSVGTVYYRRMVKAQDCNDDWKNSDACAVTVYPQVSGGTLSPSGITVNYNKGPGAIGGTATGGNGNYTYTWESSINNSTWTTITGATGPTYTPVNLTAKTYYYKRRVTSNGASDYSTTATINVYDVLQGGTISSPVTTPVDYGKFPGLLKSESLAAGGSGGYSYQWQKLAQGDVNWVNIPGDSAKLASVNSYALTVTTKFKRRVITVTQDTAYSNDITIQVYPPINAGTLSSPVSITINHGVDPGTIIGTVASAGNGGVPQYEWESSIDNGSLSPIDPFGTLGRQRDYYVGNLYPNPQVRVITSYNFKRKVKNLGPDVYSNPNPITIKVYPLLDGGRIGPITQTVNSGVQAQTLANGADASGGAGLQSYTYEWESSVNNTTWSPIPGTVGLLSYTPPLNLTATTYYKRRVRSNGVDKYSNTATVILNKLPTAFAGADRTIYLPQDSVRLTGAGSDPEGGNLGYSWVKVSGTGGTIVSSGTAITAITNLTIGTYTFGLTVTDNNGATSSVDNVIVTVKDYYNNYNYVKETVIRDPNIKTDTAVAVLPYTS